MLLKVMYRDKRYDMVKPFFLDDLILSRKIVKFQRSSGWVDVEVGPLRKSSAVYRSGPERRSEANMILWAG